MFTRSWLKDASERAIVTFSEVLLGMIPIGVPLFGIDWTAGVGLAGTAAAISVLKSIVASSVGDPNTASFVAIPYGRHAAKTE